MEYQKSIIELIKLRTSSRTYEDKALDIADQQNLADYIDQINAAQTIRCRFSLAIGNSGVSGKNEKLGTYGIITGAHSFVVGIIDKDEKDVCTFGYLFEKIILYATDLGIQTCWLGGSFSKRDFAQRVALSAHEIIPIVSPIGYKKEKHRAFESVMRAAIGANKRKPWNELFFAADGMVPLNDHQAGLYDIPLEMVRLGPSASNKQPWRLIRGQQTVHFFLCRTKGYGIIDFDVQRNDLGIAKCHFELSAIELGLQGHWQEMRDINGPAEWEYITTWVYDD